ncbi:MAG: hypothetical protein BAJALOKI2v1_350042 [Promethearchaeota archaeon]|nr:MAG: hypothetical protein BAJALOKI2v1_350042 [Candidatus Lokiarchaeota archaeon]
MEKNKNKNIQDLANAFSLIHMMDLSVVELLILELLIRHTQPVKRYILYEEVNEYLKQDGNKKIPSIKKPSHEESNFLNYIKDKKNSPYLISKGSFYYSLNSLEKRGFVKFRMDSKGKIKTVEKTEISLMLIENMIEHFIRFVGVAYDFSIVKELVDLLLERIGKKEIESILVVWLYLAFDMRLLKILENLSKKLFILSRIEEKDRFKEVGLMDIEISSILNEKIREANDIFDIVAIPYSSRYGLNGMKLIDILNEGMRVLKRDGVLVAIMEKEAPVVDHAGLDRLRELYNKANEEEIYTKKEILEILDRLSIDKFEIQNLAKHRVLLAWKT